MGIYAIHSGDVWSGLAWVVILGAGLIARYGFASAGRQPRWAAYALNWSVPAVVAAFCAERALSRDYWGVAFFVIIFGFAFVNATLLEPSPRRTALFRVLSGVLVVVSAAAIWKTVWP